MARASLSVVFAGRGGSGSRTAGTLFLRSAARQGFYSIVTQLFGPQVRGGEPRRPTGAVSRDRVVCRFGPPKLWRILPEGAPQ
jgi:hypothetical protein